ncbi:gluconate:H+ symporter [Cytophagaceae bacterium YF14B1]|uniref:Gluconate:H+ symporter n=1 Tax=Xanthocytophaga flava TaxID=3048013 RepID=A0AAE3U9Q1_9BACT|nr:gluconate:H+ symporter [Xanthocytophaga flavus]MDJ1483917.1 gluconate:H+ symporter [Xanthocytophaga flavus]
MAVLSVVFCIALLVILISWAKLNAFISFLIVSVIAGFLLKLPLTGIVGAIQKGMGDTLGSLIGIIILGAMLGKLVAESGAAQQIASVMMQLFGPKNIQWGLVCTGFIIGIPLFYSVGFVLMIPLIFSVVYRYKIPAVYIGLPMLASLSVAHGFLPPHPSPAALVNQFNANMGLTLIYGLVIAIPSIIVAGPIFSKTLKSIQNEPLQTFVKEEKTEKSLPGKTNSFLTSLLPVFLLVATITLSFRLAPNGIPVHITTFIGEPISVMLISVLVATYSLGVGQGRSISQVMQIYEGAVKDVAMIILIIAGAGALKQILTESGVSKEIADSLQYLSLPSLVLAWLIAAIIRVCIGSATIAGLTTASMVAPLIAQQHVNPNLMVLSIGAGSLMFSHVNDPGFWMFKEYFNLSLKDTLRSWSLMETIVSFCGLFGVLILDSFL